MIYIMIGTKAQFIKMAPVMKELELRGIPYNFINLGQHGATVGRLIAQFGVRSAERGSEVPNKDIVSFSGMLKWFVRHSTGIAFKRDFHLFKGQPGIALIHGDTVSTLVGLLMAKRAGLRIAHVESGLRSWNFFHPFPEELIRVICMRYSDYLFAPSEEAFENLKKMQVKGKIFNTDGNTGMDAVRAVVGHETGVRSQKSEVRAYGQPYALVSIHRFENLFSRKRFKFIMDAVNKVSERFNVVFVMHGPTERKLKKSGVSTLQGIRSQESESVIYLPLQDYPSFLRLITDAEFVITDGGSVQEECYYLGKPCLIMRKKTERGDGVGENAVLGGFNEKVISEFIDNYKRYERPESSPEMVPTKILIDNLLMLNNSAAIM